MNRRLMRTKHKGYTYTNKKGKRVHVAAHFETSHGHRKRKR